MDAKTIIDIYNVKKWPKPVIDYLNNNKVVLEAWAKTKPSRYEEKVLRASQFDAVVYGLKDILSPYYLHGYHCTRLTELEINNISANGMLLPNSDMLRQRIEKLVNDNILNSDVAKQLLSNNQANDANRANMLWFCFFPPYIASQAGIERFFRSWGGEALYNSHEAHPITGKTLSTIGIPSIIEAHVPFSGFTGHSFELNLVNRFMTSMKLDKLRVTHYEGYITVNVPPEDIISIVKFPEKRFIVLTKCDNWVPPL
jgi:hypothetical protein